ncbi:MAG: hypothetical protein JWO98_5450 [Frankiales bacterium]|nr:hypothetical protein [Frankiales bacterium]
MGQNSTKRVGTYAAEHAANFIEQVKHRRAEALDVRLDLANLTEQLTVPRAGTFAKEGVGRRLRVIERCVLNVFDIFPPDRATFLSFDECDDVAIQLHAFAINVYALFDNLAWVLVLEAGLDITPVNVGLFKKSCRPAIPKRLHDYLTTPDVLKWHNDFGKPYRDSTAHRIPLYLPSREYTPEEGVRWQELHSEAMQELLTIRRGDDVEARLARHAALVREKETLGSNSKLMALSLGDEDAHGPVYMHPQLLCDWALAHELVRVGVHSMREANNWPAPSIPRFEYP